MAEPGKPWTVTKLAAIANVSDRHCRRLFLNATGIGISDYLKQARLELAKQLLLNTSLSTTQIAERCGFAAERSLRRAWQQVMTSSPTQYRKQHHSPAV